MTHAPRFAFNRKLPLWYQIAQQLRGRIAAGELPPGSRLPTDRQLAADLQVSVITVRQALAALVDERLIVRHRGRGSFVIGQPASCRELRLIGSADGVIDQQQSEETDVLERAEIAVPWEVAPLFPGSERVTFFRRLRREQGSPLSYALDYTLLAVGRRVERELLRRYPMIKIFRDELGIRLGSIKMSVGAVAATAEIAEHLAVDISSPILRFVGVATDATARTIGVTHMYYRADRFRFTVDIDVAGDRGRSRRTAARAWHLSETPLHAPGSTAIS